MWHHIPAAYAALIALVVLHGCSSNSYVERATAIDIHKTLVADGADELILNIPAGDADVEPSEDGKLHVAVTFYCAPDSGKCAQMAQDASIIHTPSGQSTTIGFEPDSAFATRHAEMVYLFQVPRADHITVNMTAGELDVRGLDSCLSVALGAGDVTVATPTSSVRSVTLDANVGDATLHHADGRSDNRRKLLIGAEVSWTGGSGRCDNRVKLQAGDISYFLTD